MELAATFCVNANQWRDEGEGKCVDGVDRVVVVDRRREMAAL